MARHERDFEAAAKAELGVDDLSRLAFGPASNSRAAALVRFLTSDERTGDAAQILCGSFAPATQLTDIKRD